MDDIENELKNLQIPEEDKEQNDDISTFMKISEKKKNKKKSKSDYFSKYLDCSENMDLEELGKMIDEANSKTRKKRTISNGDDLFDTKGKESKKIKNIEAKFKPEIENLQRLLKDNEASSKAIKSVLDPILSSKARGSSKILTDLLLALNSSNTNRLNTIKEIGNMKKNIIDLKLKVEKDNKDTEGMAADQFGSGLFADLFNRGRANVIQEVNGFNPVENYMAENNNGNMSTPPSDKEFENVVETRLENSDAGYRSPESNLMIEYEKRKPEIYIRKSINGDMSIVAIDENGVEIEDYPVPELDDLGKLVFNADSHTCTDITGRIFKYIDD